MFNIKGKVFDFHIISDKVAQIVLQKQSLGKKVLVAVEVYGYWKTKADELKLKKGDKIRGVVYAKSNLYKNKYYTDLFFKDIELVEAKPVKGSNEFTFSDEDIIGDVKHFYDDNGNILL